MHAHIQQQRDPARTENTKSIFIKGLNIKASSGGCQTQMATTQLSSRVQRRHGRLREQESQEIGKGFSAENPAAKSSLKTRNTRWLMRSKNILGAGEPKRSMQCWRVRGRDAWMSRRHCNCLNCCSLLFQGQTLGAWQSQFCSRHRSSTQAHSLDSIKGTLGDHGETKQSRSQSWNSHY